MDPSIYLNKKDSLRNLTDAEFEVIVVQLAQALEDRGFIYDATTDEDILKDWLSLVKKAAPEQQENEIFVVPATCTVGMKVMRRYMPHFYAVKNYKGISVLSLWKKDNLEKALRFNRKYHSTPYVSEIVRSLSFTNGLGKITMYRPLMAKTIVQHFGAKSVLDVCSGWGGRMLGSLAANQDATYTGIEPCRATYYGLQNICGSLSLGERATLICDSAENALKKMPPAQRFDLALTSPPYYNLEIYDSAENTGQSMIYGSYDKWMAQFLDPVICEVLKRVTYSCWSIKNFKTDKKYNLLTDVIEIHKKYGWKMLDVYFSVKNSKRPGGSTTSTSTSTSGTGAEEYTYVFVKLSDSS
jgi:16S rRNA G966 N2-methylase RsmD